MSNSEKSNCNETFYTLPIPGHLREVVKNLSRLVTSSAKVLRAILLRFMAPVDGLSSAEDGFIVFVRYFFLMKSSIKIGVLLTPVATHGNTAIREKSAPNLVMGSLKFESVLI